MCIIFNEAGLKDVRPPCVAQSFVNHNAKLFKLFVIKDKYYTIERPSLKNFHNVAENQETVFFYSHDISKPNSSSSLTELDEIDKKNLESLMSKWQNGLKISENNSNSNSKGIQISQVAGECNDEQNIVRGQQDSLGSGCANQELSPLAPDDRILSKIVKIFSEKLSLTFYGLDIIIENETARYAIIDVNIFPGYDGVENFLTIFRDIVCDAIPKETTCQLSTKSLIKLKPTEHDSGIEST